MTVSFQNEGLLDLVAATTFGVSVKVTENPFGFFGTGLKYAIAIALRNNAKLELYLGLKRYTFTVREEKVRGEPQFLIYMGNRRLGWTTDLGKTWETWQAFREFYCNTQDEGGSMYLKRIEPKEGHTTLIISKWTEFDSVASRPQHYFLSSAPIKNFPFWYNVHDQQTHDLYYKGVLVSDTKPHVNAGNRPMRYTYDIQSKVDLTEDRTLKYRESILRNIAYFVLQVCTDEGFIKSWIMSPIDTWEGSTEWNNYFPKVSDLVCKIVGDLKNTVDYGRINKGVVDLVKRSDPDFQDHTDVQLNDSETVILKQALARMKYQFPEFPMNDLRIVLTLGEGLLGRYHNGKMYVAKVAFDAGLNCVLGTILEEYIHYHYQVYDHTPGFQKVTIDLLSTLLDRSYNVSVQLNDMIHKR